MSILLFAGLCVGALAGVAFTPGASSGATGRSYETLTTVAAPALSTAHPAGAADSRPATPAVSVAPAAAPDPSAVAGNAVTAAPTTEAQVATDLIEAIDTGSTGRYVIAATAANVSMLETWMDNEGGLWADNPLNTSLDASRYPHQLTTAGVDTGIPIFPNIEVGIAATAATLLANRAYAGILAVLSEGAAPCAAFARAVIASPWAASHYGHDTARFCGASGGSQSVPVGTPPACLRLGHGGRGSHRMPGTCGRRGDNRAAAAHAPLATRPSHQGSRTRHPGATKLVHARSARHAVTNHRAPLALAPHRHHR